VDYGGVYCVVVGAVDRFVSYDVGVAVYVVIDGVACVVGCCCC